MAIFTVSTPANTVTFTADTATDDNYDVQLGSRLIDNTGAYITDANGTHLILGFGYDSGSNDLDRSTVWSSDVV